MKSSEDELLITVESYTEMDHEPLSRAEQDDEKETGS